MNDVIGHLIGTCGENHPNLLTTSSIGVGISGFFSYIILIIKSKLKS